MSKPTITSLQDRISALEAQLAATQAWGEEWAAYAESLTARRVPTPVITTYTDHQGRVWEKTRLGNRASSRLLTTN